MKNLLNSENMQVINLFVQTLAIIIAGSWILGYNLIYKDIYIPSKEPTHITPLISVKTHQSRNGYTPITVTVEIENESNREVYTLPGILQAIGIIYSDANLTAQEYTKEISKELNEDIDMFHGKYNSMKNTEVIALGGIFKDMSLSPRENYRNKYLFYIPNHKFSAVEIRLGFYAHKDDNDNLWTKSKVLQNDFVEINPCIIKSEEPWICEELPDTKEINDKYDLSFFDSRVEIPIP